MNHLPHSSSSPSTPPGGSARRGGTAVVTKNAPTDITAEGSPTIKHYDDAMRRKVIIASMVGTTIEFYDFYAYASASVAVFPYLFFPKNEDPTIGLLASFATFGLAFIARPVGSILFGHFGDRVGRKVTLVASLLTMGIATFIIGLLPTYASIGIAAPALLALMRFCQGLGLGGEWSGAALLSTETAQSGRRAWAAMWPQLGAPFGFLLANGLFLIITTAQGYNVGDLTGAFMSWGWRIPFLLSSVMVIIGLWARFSLHETPVFQKAVNEGLRVKAPLVEVFKISWLRIIQGTFVMVSCYTLFYLITTWVLSYGIGNPSKGVGLGIPYHEFLILQLISIFLFMFGVPISAATADRHGRKKTLTVVSILIMCVAATFPWLLNMHSATTTTVLIFLSLGMFVMGLVFGPMSAVLPELFPTAVRYTGSGVAYNVSSILGAAIAPFIATWLVKAHGVGSVGIYLAAMAILSLIAILAIPETKSASLDEI